MVWLTPSLLNDHVIYEQPFYAAIDTLCTSVRLSLSSVNAFINVEKESDLLFQEASLKMRFRKGLNNLHAVSDVIMFQLGSPTDRGT